MKRNDCVIVLAGCIEDSLQTPGALVFLQISVLPVYQAEDMTCELHDEVAAGSQFVTHFTGRVLERLALSSGPINTKARSSPSNQVHA